MRGDGRVIPRRFALFGTLALCAAGLLVTPDLGEPQQPGESAPSQQWAQYPPPPPGPPQTYGQPAPTTPPDSVVQECNQYAASQTGNRDKTTEVAKDSLLGGLGGAALGAGIGAIAGGGRGAARGAAIGGGVGLVGGALYGINENNKNDESYRSAYGSCLRSRGY